MFRKIDHIGIAVRNVAASARLWSGRLGMPLGEIETLASEGVRVAFLGRGETHVELIEPLDGASPVARFLERRGEGVHHICVAVDDIETAVATLRAEGMTFAGEAPRPGAGGGRVAFLHPKETGGVLLELSQKPAVVTLRVAPGEAVLVYLQNPKEKFWGILRDAAVWGVTVEGIDLSSFESWLAIVSQGETAHATTALFPSHRIEKVLLDRATGDAESLEERLRKRIGTGLADFLDRVR
jgi:methylmalonyl-CoA/ethylmalonyl-CoA epimerase